MKGLTSHVVENLRTPTLYKFTEKEWMRALFEKGSIRLGTVFDFKKVEQYGLAVGDPHDGTLPIQQIVRSADGMAELENPWSQQFIKLSECTNGTIDAKFTQYRSTPNAWLFSTSARYSDDLFVRWNQEKRYDACYEIVDQVGFARAINEAILAKVGSSCFPKGSKWFIHADVQYFDLPLSHTDPRNNQDPAFVKDKRSYGWQDESRMLWRPEHDPTRVMETLFINIRKAWRFCRPFKTMDAGSPVSCPLKR